MRKDDRVRPVLLLHGWGGSFADSFAATGWRKALAAAGREIIAIDLPGHGTGPKSHDPADYADLAAALIPELPAEPVDIIGYSLGAKLMLELALRVPTRVGRLVAGGIGDNIFAPEPVAGEAIGWLTAPNPDAAPPPLNNVIAKLVKDGRDLHALAAILGRPANPRFDEQRIASLRAPLLLVVGDRDEIAGSAARLTTALPAMTTLTLPGVGHFDLVAAAAFRDAAGAFLAANQLGDAK